MVTNTATVCMTHNVTIQYNKIKYKLEGARESAYLRQVIF